MSVKEFGRTDLTCVLSTSPTAKAGWNWVV